ncbi:unnamed protein product [Ixodes hexagonus]
MATVLLLFCAVAAAFGAVVAGSAEFTVTVLHTNDVHGRFEEITPDGTRCPKTSAEKGLCVGGIARQKKLVDDVRSKGGNVLFLNTGDYYQGSLWYYLLGAQIVVDAVNYLQHDAMTLGNHEFDRGAEGMAPLVRNSTVPILGCNVDFSDEPLLRDMPLRPSMTLEVGGHQVGLIGYVTPNTVFLSQPGKVRFTDEVECVRREAKKLRSQGVKVIIAMGHSGLPKDKEIAEAVPEVSLVVGGHTHTFLYSGPTTDGKISGNEPQGPYPVVVERADGTRSLVVQDFWMGKYMGYINVTWNEQGEPLRWEGQPVLLDSSIGQDPAGLALLDKYRPLLESKRTESVAHTQVLLQGDKAATRFAESNLGNVVTEAFLKYLARMTHREPGSWSSVAAAVANGGGFRAPIDEQSTGGVITFEDVVNVIPFGNTLVLLNLTGSQLKRVVEHGVALHDPTGLISKGEFLQMAGMRVEYDISRQPWDRVVKLKILCTACRVPVFEDVVPDKWYRIAAVSYIVKGGDNFDFSFVKPQDRLDTGYEDVGVVVEYLNATSPVTMGLDGRITFVQDGATKPNHAGALAPNILATLLSTSLVLLSMVLWRSQS